MPELWRHPGVSAEQRRELSREVFREIRLRKEELVAVAPRAKYTPLFAYALWKQHQIAGGARSA